MKPTAILAIAAICCFNSAYSQTPVVPQPSYLVNYDDYENLVKEVKEYRSKRLIFADSFHKLSQDSGVVILDTRSDSMYKLKHIKGAIHLNFSDFTQSNLEKLIPNKNTKILIYCNNNFLEQVKLADLIVPVEAPYFASKAYIPRELIKSKLPPKPVTLALNIPTFINLYGYGYRNIYELHELVYLNNTVLEFEGTAVKN